MWGFLLQSLKRIVDAKDNKEIFKHFKAIILKAYGEKSQDGRRFIKSEELSEEFAQTEAFVELIMELASSETAAAEFVNGIIPKPVQQVTSLNK